MIIPSRFAQLFYAEYGAYADRKYMTRRRDDYWSRLIESSHAFCCAFFCLLALICMYNNDPYRFMICVTAGMASQFMNSLLYMGEYFQQCSDLDSPNYNSRRFPVGKWLLCRPFMWINIFWMLLPSYIIVVSLGMPN
jgi:hypothetical protein